MLDPYVMALDLKDRYARFLHRRGRLSYLGDVHEFVHTLPSGSRLVMGEELGTGAYARVNAVELVMSDGTRQQLVRRVYLDTNIALQSTALADAHRAVKSLAESQSFADLSLHESLKTLPKEMHTSIGERFANDQKTKRDRAYGRVAALEEKYRVAVHMSAGQFGRILGTSLDATLETAIAPIIGFGFERISEGCDAFTLYQSQDDVTLERALRTSMRSLGRGSLNAALHIADLVDATCAMVGKTAAAGYIDADFKSPNVGVTQKPHGGCAVRTIDLGEFRPVGALRAAFEQHIALNPQDRDLLASRYMTGSLEFVPTRKLDAFATHHPTERQIAVLPEDDRAALAITLARDLFDMYAALHKGDDHFAPLHRQVLYGRYAFIDQKTKKTGPAALEPYRPILERAIEADVVESDYATTTFLQDLCAASDEVRAYARRTQHAVPALTTSSLSPEIISPIHPATLSARFR